MDAVAHTNPQHLADLANVHAELFSKDMAAIIEGRGTHDAGVLMSALANLNEWASNIHALSAIGAIPDKVAEHASREVIVSTRMIDGLISELVVAA